MSEVFNFVDKKLVSIMPPKNGQVMYRDKKEKGLVLRASYAGSKSFYLYKYFDGRPRLIKIGNFPRVSIADARIAARELKNKIESGQYQDISKHPRTNQLTFKELVDEYITQHVEINSNNPQKSKKDVLKRVKNASHLFDKTLSVISKKDMQAVFDSIVSRGSHIEANRVIAYLSPIFNRAVAKGYIDCNPTQNIKKNKERRRDRYITIEEKDRFFKALYELENETMRDIFLLALFTGARKGNIVSMRWDKISFENKTWTIPAKSNINKQGSKNGMPLVIHLNEESMTILSDRKKASSSKWVFPSDSSKSGHIEEPRKAWNTLLKKAKIEDLRIHDLRHTHASWMAINGVSLPIIGKALGHRSIQSTARYSHLNDDSVREAVNNTFNGVMMQPDKKD